MENKIYVIAISGCDDTSYAIFEDFTEEELAFLKQLQTEINWFSTCSCQPTIRITNDPDDYYYRNAFKEVAERAAQEAEEATKLLARKKEWQENCKF